MRIIKSLADVQQVIRQILNWQENETAVSNRNQQGYQIKNAGAATDPTDLVTLGQVQDLITSAKNLATPAISSTSSTSSVNVGPLAKQKAAVARAVVASAGGFKNPMTSFGDLIYGGAKGIPTRLAAATLNTFNVQRQFIVEDNSQTPYFSVIEIADLPTLSCSSFSIVNTQIPLSATQLTFNNIQGLGFPPGMYLFTAYLIAKVTKSGGSILLTPNLSWVDADNTDLSTAFCVVNPSTFSDQNPTSHQAAYISFPITLVGRPPIISTVISSGSGTYSLYVSLVNLMSLA